MSSPVAPNQQLQSAEQSINQAEHARVADYASPELREAREKLTAARSAVHDEDMTLAKRLAEESKVEADLALAKAQMVKAQQVNDEIQKGTDSMQQEMQRNTGATQ
jgi:ATP phosphoribosyltransferase regulatory subunit HisZ